MCSCIGLDNLRRPDRCIHRPLRGLTLALFPFPQDVAPFCLTPAGGRLPFQQFLSLFPLLCRIPLLQGLLQSGFSFGDRPAQFNHQPPAVGPVLNFLGKPRPLRIKVMFLHLKLIHNRFELVEALPVNRHIQQRLKKILRLFGLGIKRPGQPPLPHPDQLGEHFPKEFRIPEPQQRSEKPLNLRLTVGTAAPVNHLYHLVPEVAADTALHTVTHVPVLECDIDLPSRLTMTQKVSLLPEVLLKLGLHQEKGVTYGLNQCAFPMAVAPRYPVDPLLECHRDTHPLGPCPVGFDVLESDRLNDHTATSTESPAAPTCLDASAALPF